MNIHAALYGATSHLNLYVRPPVILQRDVSARDSCVFARNDEIRLGLHNYEAPSLAARTIKNRAVYREKTRPDSFPPRGKARLEGGEG